MTFTQKVGGHRNQEEAVHQDRIMSRTLIKAVGAGTALTLALAPAALAGNGNGQTPPGQEKEAAPAAAPPAHAPAHGVRGTSPQTAPKAKKAKPAPPAHAPAHGRRSAQKPPSPQRAASQTAPTPKQDRSKTTPSRGNSAIAHERVTFCHATGSATNPYVEITTSRSAVIHAHDDHQDGRDIIPAPAGGCPAEEAPAATGAQQRSGARDVPATPVTPAGTPTVERMADVLAAPGPADTQTLAPIALTHELVPEKGESAVLGATASSAPESDAAEAAPRGEVATVDAEGGLPFTGLELLVVVAAGIAALLAGFALHRASATRS